MNTKSHIGLIGLAVMGQNLVLNMNDHGFRVAVYNRTAEKTDDFLSGPAKGTDVVGCHSIEALFDALASPRIIMMMVKAGRPVDQMIDQLLPHLKPGDLLIDGGNSHFADTTRRTQMLAQRQILFIGAGVSGGEEGARRGPSIMPGGNCEAWPLVKDLLQAIAAKVDDVPCCLWVGDDGAGHFVKMVHNGIEYGDMQLQCEAYDLMKRGLGLSNPEMHTVFSRWNQGVLNSYLAEITADILGFQDDDGEPLLEKILDTAGQKGTGKWTGITALELGVPLTLIGEAVFARCLSARKEERLVAAEQLETAQPRFDADRDAALEALHDALYAAKIVSYAQGFMLLREAANEYRWSLEYGDIALTWRGGCIIRSRFLDKIKEAYSRDPTLQNLLLDEFFVDALKKAERGWRQTVMLGVELGIPTPALSSALAFFDGYRSGRLPANLLQAQRDYFGAHLYERIDRPRGQFFHTDWTGHGGATASTPYEV